MPAPQVSTRRDFWLVLCILALILIFTAFAIGQPKGLWTLEFWVGPNEGMLAVVGSIGTVATAVAAAVGIYFLNRRTKHSERTLELQQVSELAGRFQKGVELLAENSVTARTAGMQLLREVAYSAPNQYHVPVLNTLAAFVRETTIAHRVLVKPSGGEGKLSIKLVPGTPRDVIEAFAAIGYIRRRVPHREFERDVGRPGVFLLLDTVLKDCLVMHKDFSNMSMASVTFIDCNFDHCDFSESQLSGRFFNCTFSHCKFSKSELQGDFETGAESSIWFRFCDMMGATVSVPDGRVRVISSTVDALELRAFDPGVGGSWYRSSKPTVTASHYPDDDDDPYVPVIDVKRIRTEKPRQVVDGTPVYRFSEKLIPRRPRDNEPTEEAELPF